MKPETIEKLCCPFDKSDLALEIVTRDPEGNIIEGYFTCQDCNRVYPIVRGLPIMNPDEYREFHLEKPLYQKWGLKGSEDFRLLDK